MMRLSKFIADCGVASRREAERLIETGAVSVNGVIINSPVFFVNGDEIVLVNNKRIQRNEEIEVYMFHKPLNTMTTAKDPENRKTIYDVLDEKYRNLKYIGRLDYKTTGLLLLTNNGEVARKLSLPKNQIPRTYIADVRDVNEIGLDRARKGIFIEGIQYKPMKIDIVSDKKLRVTVTEGKKNEIRIVLKYVGSPVMKLHRISYGNIKLGNLPIGKIVKIDKKTIDLMLKNL